MVNSNYKERNLTNMKDKLVNKAIEKTRILKINYSHKKDALSTLKSIENDTGYKLSNRKKSLIKDYAKEILGSKEYAYWLYVYATYNQKFEEGWIPDNYFEIMVNPVINKNIRNIAYAKTISKKIINSD